MEAYEHFSRWFEAAQEKYQKLFRDFEHIDTILSQIDEDHPNYNQIVEERDLLDGATDKIIDDVIEYCSKYGLDVSDIDLDEDFLAEALDLFQFRMVGPARDTLMAKIGKVDRFDPTEFVRDYHEMELEGQLKNWFDFHEENYNRKMDELIGTIVELDELQAEIDNWKDNLSRSDFAEINRTLFNEEQLKGKRVELQGIAETMLAPLYPGQVDEVLMDLVKRFKGGEGELMVATRKREKLGL